MKRRTCARLASACNSASGHAAIRQSLCKQFAGLDREEFVAVFLDAQAAVMRSAVMFRGNKDFVVVSLGAVARAALQCGAASILVAHNHTTDSAEPSAHDVRFTRRLALVMAIVGIPLLDHLIVAANGAIHSMTDAGSWTAPLDEFAAFMGDGDELHTRATEGAQ